MATCGARFAALALAITAGATAQPTRHGPQLRVDANTAFVPGDAVLAMSPDGAFVVVWRSLGSAGTDQNETSVQARRFAADGSPASGPWQVNTSTLGNERDIQVAPTSAGGFIVVWAGPGPTAQDDAMDIRARRYDAGGAALGDDFQVNSDTTSSQQRPAIAVDPVTGDFLVAWLDDADDSLQGRRFEHDGAPTGPQFPVDLLAGGNPTAPAVAPLGDGAFVVAWEGQTSAGDDLDWSIQALRFDATGDPIGEQFQVNAVTTGVQEDASVAGNGDGTFVVAWASASSAGDDDSGCGIQARRFDASGAPAGPQFQVNSYTPGYQSEPTVAVDGHGHLLVVWNGQGSAGTDQDAWSVHGRRYGAGSDPIGDEFQVNTDTTGYQSAAWVANDALGDFVVTWSDSVGGDSSVLAQRFDDVFREDFEAGDWARWSPVAP